MRYDMWTKKLDDIHFARCGSVGEGTLCGKPMIGNNYMREYEEIDKSLHNQPRAMCLECSQILAQRLSTLEKKEAADNQDNYKRTIPLESGNTIEMFFNPDGNLLVLDLIAANQEGGFEFIRMNLDEAELLQHVKGIVTAPPLAKQPVLILTDSGSIDRYHIKQGLKCHVPSDKKNNKKEIVETLKEISRKTIFEKDAAKEALEAKLLNIEELAEKALEDI